MESFGTDPALWLVQHEDLLRELSGGRALDLACGNGRNAYYLARFGLVTDALDVSDRAVTWTSQRAAEKNLPIHTRRVDLESVQLENELYQVIVNFNFLCRGLFPQLEPALAPGGLLIFETFSIDQKKLPGHEKRKSHMLEHNELLRAFPTLRVLSYREAVLNEGPFGRSKAVASIVARKEP